MAGQFASPRPTLGCGVNFLLKLPIPFAKTLMLHDTRARLLAALLPLATLAAACSPRETPNASARQVNASPGEVVAPTGLGRFGEFGGRFVPETLVPALEELEAEFRIAWQ